MNIREACGYAAGLSMVVVSATARATQPPNNPPILVGKPYDFVVDLSPPGLETFSFSGTAFDPDPGQTVRVYTGYLNPRIQFDSTPGNPAMFNVRVDGLSRADFGGFEFFITAEDDVGRSDGAIFSIRLLLPEPTSATALIGAVTLAGRRVRARCHG